MKPTPRRDEVPRPPTAFVSYAHGDDVWDSTVLDFAAALRTVGGIDADLDRWNFTTGQDWTTYGPTAIRRSDFILIAVSPTYKEAWQGENPGDRNAGAAREAAAIKATFDRDQHGSKRRVKIVLLPGVDLGSIPDVLYAAYERFTVASFDLQGLEKLLRSIHDRPLDSPPPLGPLPALPPRIVAELGMQQRQGGEAHEVAASVPDGGDQDRAHVDALVDRLKRIERDQASDGSADLHAEDPDERSERLRLEHAAVTAALVALGRALRPLGATRQRMIGDYLNAQLYFSAGAYDAAATKLAAVADRLRNPEADPTDSVFEECLRQITKDLLEFNERMRTRRHAAPTNHRHPQPPQMQLDLERVRGVCAFYEVARSALRTESPRSLGIIRSAILRGRKPPEKHAARLGARYTHEQEIAGAPLALAPLSDGENVAGARALARADLDVGDDSVATDVLAALAAAHFELHLVERRRSGPVGAILGRGKDDVDEDCGHLRRSIVLNTFALTSSESVPWIFAANDSEREEIQRNPADAWRDLVPVRAVWHARQVTLLALYRRSHGFRLLGDSERAYNDLRKLQRLGRLTRQARKDDGMLTGWIDTLEALAEYRIGELYRADHDYMQALVHLCRSHDSVHALESRKGSGIAKELGHLQIKLSLGKGKAFFEIGAMKRSLKWHLTALRWLLTFEPESSVPEASLLAVEQELDRVKHDPLLYKEDVQDAIAPVLGQVCERQLRREHHALAADILVRISHLLTVLRLPEDRRDTPSNVGSSVLRCMKRAAQLDERNLLVHTGLLRYDMRHNGSKSTRRMPDPMSCWPSGASDVDQVIRAAEHLMLERLHAAGGPTGTREVGVARALMSHFMTHTDSINLRGAILHRYLMRRRAEDREPWWDDVDSDLEPAKTVAAMTSSSPYLEFVCRRRFGSFTPFMPRPAAVSAVGGGYLVRVVRSARDGGKLRTKMFNIIVDPGEGAVNNLYAMGLSISDIDMVVATHDHPEHLAALDAILSLRGELHERERVKPPGTNPAIGRRAREGGRDRRLLILGNRSVVNRYGFLNGDGHHLVQHIADASVLGGLKIPAGVKIEELPTKHKDLGGHDASAFVLSLTAPEFAPASLRIAFMADTAIEGLHEYREAQRPTDSRWTAALESDVVVAHVSDVPSGELRFLAKLPPADDEDAIAEFDAGVRKLAAERPADASQLMHALSLVSPDPGADPQPVSLLAHGAVDNGEQLYLRGLLNTCDRMYTAAKKAGGEGRILVVGELREQLGSFRGTIAREINRNMLDLQDVRHGESSPRLIALTADIGLRIRVTATTTGNGDVERRNTVLCSTCSHNNDRLDIERFHPPQDIYEVCVKGDHEAMYWNCDLHDPGLREPVMFVEQMGGYNPFAAGGRYHG